MRRFRFFSHHAQSRGNIFAMLFAAVALVGVLGAVGMQTLTGPVTTMARVTQRNVADNNLLMDAKILVNAAVAGVSGGDPDGDGVIEPAAFIPAAVGETAPVNGGFLPTDLGLALTDPWGTKYGYCVWDHGTTNASTNRIDGDNTASASTQAVIAIIAAGPDKEFQTTCSAYSGGPVQVTKSSGSDDLIFKYSYAEAAASSNGLWTINVSDDAKAELKDTSGSAVNVTIDRDTGIGDFLGLTTSIISAKTDQTIALDGGLLLDADGGGATTCTAAEKGSLRLNSARDDLELCDGAGGWVEVRTPPGGSAGHVQFNDGAGGFGGDANLFWDNTGKRLGVGGSPSSHTLDVTGSFGASGNGTIGGTLGVTGATTLSSTLGVTGAATLSSTLNVAGSATFDTSTLFVDAAGDKVGIGTAAPSTILHVVGTTEQLRLGYDASQYVSATVDSAGLVTFQNHPTTLAGGANMFTFRPTSGPAVGGYNIANFADHNGASVATVDGSGVVTGKGLRTSDGWITSTPNGPFFVTSSFGAGGGPAFIFDTTQAPHTIAYSFRNGGTPLVTLAGSGTGNVGIGTTAPAAKLDVAGGVKIGADAVCNASKAGMAAWNANQLQICDGTSFKNISAIDKLDDIGDVEVPSPNNNEILAWDSGTSRWVAKNVNTVGSAIATPGGTDGQLQFNDGGTLAGAAQLYWDKTNDRLGIGTDTPYGQFQLSAGGQPALLMESVSGSVNQKVGRLVYDGGGVVPGGGFVFQRMTDAGAFSANLLTIVQATGNIGVGTLTPQSLLHVAGGIQLGDDTASCPGASNEKLGTLRFNGGNLQVCKSAGWSGVGSGGGSGQEPYLRLSYGGDGTLFRNNPIPFTVAESGGGATWNTTQFTAPIAGVYIMTAQTEALGSANHVVHIMKNGGTNLSRGFEYVTDTTSKRGGASAATAAYLAAGDTIEFQYGHDSGAVALLQAYASIAYLGGGSDTLGGLSCSSGEIPKWNGTAWACAVDGGGSGGASSMLPGWPDAILCTGSNGTSLFNLSWQNAAVTATHYTLAGDYGQVSSNTPRLTFPSMSGAATAEEPGWTNWTTNCNGKTIAQLYASGQAFNFVGGSSGSGELVAFFAKDSSTNLPAGTWADVVFPTEVLDAGGDNYDPATGKFTAPSDGVYQFSANINFGSLTNERGLIIQKADPGAALDNRVCTSYLNSNATTTTYTANCSGSIYLTAGDQVEVTARDNPGSNLAGELRNTFSGFKVGSGGAPDTLAGLSCASGEIPKWNGSAWECAADGGGGSPGPQAAFFAHKNGTAQSISAAGSYTKITFGTESFDVDGRYDPSTGRFTPPAGKYVVGATIAIDNYTAGQRLIAQIYKNGSAIASSSMGGYGNMLTASPVAVIDANGTDYFEVYAQITGGTFNIVGSPAWTNFYGYASGGGGSGTPGGADTQVQFNDNGTMAGAAQLFWDKANNRLGVGVGAPAQALDVGGAVTSNKLIFKTVTGADAPISGSTYWSSDGTNAWRTSGNVGIGTNAPGYKLDVNGSSRFTGTALFNSTVDINNSSGTASLYLRPGDDISYVDQRMYTSDGSTADYWRFLIYGKSYASTSWQRRLRIMSYDGGTGSDVMTLMANGNIGLGVVSPAYKLDIDGSLRITGHYYANGNLYLGQNNTATSVYGSTGAANYLQLAASDSADDGARIILYGRTHGSSGRIYLQSSSNSAADLVHQVLRRKSDGTAYAVMYTYGDGVTRFYGTNGSGSCYIDGDGPSTTCTSDERLKKDIETIPNALESLVKIRGVSFNWKEEFKNDPGRKKYGVIAQELQAAFPDLVVEGDDGYLQASMDGLIPVLVESVKELKADNDNLRAELNAANEKLQKIDASILKRLDALEAHAMQ